MTTDIWNGNGFWATTTGDWSLGAAPNSAQEALIQSGTDTLNTTGAVAAGVTVQYQATLSVTGAGALSATNLTVYGGFNIDTGGGDGGGSVALTGTFNNVETSTIGNNSLSASVTVTAVHFSNSGSLYLNGNANLGSTAQASLSVSSAAPSALTGKVYIGGDALLDFGSGGITTIAGGAELQLVGHQASVAIGSGAANSALTGLATNLGTLDLEGDNAYGEGGASLTTNTALFNTGTVQLDVYGSDGASQMTVGGTLTNDGTIDIGNSSLSNSSTMTVNALINLGTVDLYGNEIQGTTEQATFNVLTAAPSTWTGNLYVHGDSDVNFNSGSIVSIGVGSEIQLDGVQSRISSGGGTANSALDSFATNYGTFDEEGDWTTGPGGSVVSTTPNFTNYHTFDLDIYGGDGASSFTDVGVFTNDDYLQIGNDSLSANTTMTVGGLTNNGTIFVDSQKTGGAGHAQAALVVNAAAPSAWTGYLRVDGDSRVQFTSTNSISSIAAGGIIEIDGGAANIANASAGQNSALLGLATNQGTLLLRGNNGFGAGVTLTTNTSYNNLGTTQIDYYGSDGGDTVTFGGTLTNSGTLEIGNQSLAASTNVQASSFANTGVFVLQGSTASGTGLPTAKLNISGAASATVTGYQAIRGAATLNYVAGATGPTSIFTTGGLEVDGSNANVSLNGGAQNSALAKLQVNNGTFLVRGGSGYGSGGVTLTTTTAFINQGTALIDYYGSDGGSTVKFGGALSNFKYLYIGNQSLSNNTYVQATSFTNSGTLVLQGSSGSGTVPNATLDITGTMPASTTGVVRLSGNALLYYSSGTGYTTIAHGGFFELDGSQASVAVGTGGQNSGLASLSINFGTLLIRGNGNFGTGGVTLTTKSTNYYNYGTTWIEYYGSDGGSDVTFGGVLYNVNNMDVGNQNLSVATSVQATGLIDTGTLVIQGNTSLSGPSATMTITGAAAANLPGTLRVSGSATLSFGSGTGITDVLAGGFLELDGHQANITISGGAQNSGVANLATNGGTFLLRGDGNFGAGAVDLTTSTGYLNTGTTWVDIYGGDGGSDLTFGGTLNNQGTFNLGSTDLSAASTVNAGNLRNYAGQINISGGNGFLSTMAFTGAAFNYASVTVGTGGVLSSTQAYTQYGGSTTINGTLSASAYTQYGGSTTVNGTLSSAGVNAYGGGITFDAALTSASPETTLRLEDGGTFAFEAGVSSSQTVLFQDATSGIALYQPGSFDATISGFANGDAIDLINQAATSLSYSGGVLDVSNGGSQIAALHFSGSYTTSSFTLAADNHGGTLILA